MERRRKQEKVGAPLFIALDELPWIYDHVRAADEQIAELVRLGRGVGVFTLAAAQDFFGEVYRAWRGARQLPQRLLPGRRPENWISAVGCAAARDVFLSEDLVAELAEWEATLLEHQRKPGKRGKHGNRRNILDPGGEPWNLIFPSKTGGPITATNLLRCLDSEAVTSKIGSITVHHLRHTAGSLMLQHGETMTTVSKILGHSSVEVTSRIYAHSYEDDKRNAVTQVSSQLRKRSKKEEK